MIENIAGRTFFHMTRSTAVNAIAPMVAGQTLEIGQRHNPFFAFYEVPRTYRVNLPEGPVQSPMMTFFRAVKEGQVQPSNLASDAFNALQHYLMLVRELVSEEVRKEAVPAAPSRQVCIWLSETVNDAEHWRARLGGGSVAELECTGTIARVDAGFLLGDAEPLSRTYERARRYWLGETSERPEPEILFTGTATVISVA